MKRVMALTLVTLLSLPALAEKGGFEGGKQAPSQQQQDAGYKGSEDTGQTHINQIRDFRPDGYVTLEGYIVKKEQGERYQFRDKTGNITIIAPEKTFGGKKYTAKDQVRVSGRVKGKGSNTILHVERIEEP